MLKLTLITPEREVFSSEIYEAIIPTQEGQITILPNHLPIISLLKPGIISIRKNKSDKNDQMEHIAINGGFIEMDGQIIKVMADSAIKSDEVNEIEANEARRKAQELKEKATNSVSLADATSALEQSIIRLKLANLKKKRHSSQ
jgi:F-type H+-transporting ATPase subunit epsilon